MPRADDDTDGETFGPVYSARVRAVLFLTLDGVDPAVIMRTFGISRPTYYRWLADARQVEARRKSLRVVGP